MKKFVVKHSDALFAAHYIFPAFALINTAPSLHQNMLRNLRQYGLTIQEIRIEGGHPNLADAHVTYSFNALNMLITVWLERVEVLCSDLRRARQEQVLEMAMAALESLHSTVPELQIETYTATLNLHGIPSDTESAQFITPYVHSAPEGLGTVLGSGVVYYFGPEAERRSASLVMDMSAVIPEAVFIKMSVVFDGTKLTREQIPSAIRDYLSQMLTSLHLEPDWEA